jgi:hypothetical protein
MENIEWCSIYKALEVNILASRSFNHKLVMVVFSESGLENKNYKQGFKFEVSWVEDEECSNVIKEAWVGRGMEENIWECRRENEGKKKTK